MTPGSGPDGSSPSRWLTAFGLTYAALDLAPPFLTRMVSAVLTVGDVVNIVAPFLVVGLVWKLRAVLRSQGATAHSERWKLASGVLAVSSALYLNGKGMHLAANAVTRQLADAQGSSAWQAAYLFDEVLSHVVADAGLVGMSLALLTLAVGSRPRSPSPALLAGAVLFGFSWFVDGVEGGTVALMLPAAILALGAILVSTRGRLAAVTANPVQLFYLASFGVAVVMFLTWWIWQGGFPEFSQLGWI